MYKKIGEEYTMEEIYEKFIWEFEDPFESLTKCTEDPEFMEKYL